MSGDLLDDVLREVAAQRTGRAEELATGDPALSAFAVFMGGGVPAPITGATAPGDVLVAAAIDTLREARGAADVAHDLPALALGVDPGTRPGAFALYLATEAALAAARLDQAAALRALAPEVHLVWRDHPYQPVLLACAARTEIFAGNITAALALLKEATASACIPDSISGHLLRATHALAAGNAADVVTMRSLIAEVEGARVAPVDHLGRGVHLLLAFGVIALGDTRAAVRHLLAAGGGADLDVLTVIDRILAFELVVAAAAAEDDLAAAEAWLARAEQLAGRRAAVPALHRIRSRVLLLAGDAPAAEREAGLAVDAAAAEGRAVEQAEAEIVRARARIAARRLPDATRDLRAAVASGDGTGHHAVRHAAARELRPARRRLPPPTGAGWEGLSEREREVAEMILAGADNAAIATRLTLSPATVRTHTTRVLAAFGVGTRIGLLAATRAEAGPVPPPPELTRRQAEVAGRVAAGRSNAEVAADLGIGVKSVERHVGAILQRWNLTDRFDLAHRWWSGQDRSAG